MLDMKKLLTKIINGLFIYDSFDLGTIGVTSGTAGTIAKKVDVNVAKTGYTPISWSPQFIDTSVVTIDAFSLNATTVRVNFVRATNGSFSATYHAYLHVVYKKN